MKIDLEDMTDVCEGPMTLKTLHNEICHYMTYKHPKKIVIIIERDDKAYISPYKSTSYQNYHTTIYIPIKDFDRALDVEEISKI